MDPVVDDFHDRSEVDFVVTSAKNVFTSGGHNLRPDGLRPPYASLAP